MSRDHGIVDVAGAEHVREVTWFLYPRDSRRTLTNWLAAYDVREDALAIEDFLYLQRLTRSA